MGVVKAGMGIGVIIEACVNVSRDAESLQIIQGAPSLLAYEYFASYHVDSVDRVGMMVAEIAPRGRPGVEPMPHQGLS
ncbi:hypothetical protein GCM10027565_42520 [Bordetella tumulicola]